jgi:predicted MPP superfamily phosphohydrolase
MRTIIQFLAFVSVFFLLFLTLNYFVFYGIAALFNLPHNTTYYILLILMAISYPAAAMIERNVSNGFTRAFYTISSAWMGIALFLIYIMVIYGILFLFFKISPSNAGIVIVVLAGILSVYSIINSFFLDIKEIEIPISGLKENLRVVQLSDIHIGSIRNSGYMERIVEETNKLEPDLVLITGDMVDGSARLHTHTFSAINKFKSPVFFVTGNHESYEGLDEVKRILKSTKIKILENEMFEFGELQIIGVDYSMEGQHLKKTLSNIRFEKSKPSILLYHLPKELEEASDAGINLQLSGHTHNGQIYPFNFLVKLMFPYMTGLYEYEGTFLYVSEGTGTWGPPMRLGSRCEITLIRLKSDSLDYKN